MATTNKRFVAKNGLDNNGNTITNVGASGNSLGISGTGDLTITISGTATLTVPAGSDTLVTLTGTQTLTNKTLTTPVIATISNTGTLTLPTSTDTLVGRATTDTLTNKTISGSNNTLSNIGNSSLTNSSVSYNGVSVALGASGTLYTDDISEDGSPVNLWFTNTRARAAVGASDAGGDGSFTYDSGTGVFTYTGPSATEVRAHLSAGTGLTYSSGQFAIDSTVATLTGTQTLTNKTISGADNTLSNIGNSSLTNSSITINGTSVSLGGTRTLVTDDIAEDGSPVNLWYTDTRSRAAISVTDSGGDGSLSYNSGSGVITYTGPSASEVRAHFSAGTGVTLSSGQISIGQSVGTGDNVTFAGVTADNIRVGVTAAGEIDTSAGNLTLDSTGGTTVMDDDVNITGNLLVDGNLTVSGTTVTINTTNLAVEDNMIYLNNGSTVSNPDLGFAGNYNDGTYRHAGIFRDASDGVWKFYHQYTPEPDASAYIDITHGSFALAAIQAASFTGSVTGNVTGNASTATAWQTARTLTLSGDVTGTSAAFDGSGNISITTTIAADSVALGTDTTGNYVASITNGSYITGADGGSEGAGLTLAVDATSANTASKVVARDSSGNFAAGTITAALSGNASTATTLQTARNINGVSFNGSADITVADSTKLPLAGGTLTGAITESSTTDQGITLNATDNSWKYIGFSHSGTRKAYFGLDSSGNPTWGTDSGGFTVVGATAFTISGNQVLTAGNYNSYSPTLTGTGASGTWGINITGNAATATSATDSTKLPLAGGTMTGVLLTNTSSALATSDYTRIMHPGGASYVTQSPTVTGAIKIKMPVISSGMMMTATVKVYEYSTGKSFELVFGGHRDSNNWYNEFCYMVGDENRDEINVRFGIDATTNCVWIGETNSSWSYPQVFVTDVQLGYAGYSASWTTGWNISFVTSFDTINRGPRTARRQLTSGNYSSYALPLTGGTITGNLTVNTKIYAGGATVNSGYNGVYATNMVGAASGNKLIYLYNDGTNIKLDAYDYGVSGALSFNIGGNGGTPNLYTGSTVNNNVILHAGNYSSYALPLSGGTVGYTAFVSANDTQIQLSGGTSPWAGIAFNDVSGTDYLWFWGATGTWSFGGGGSSSGGKKVHVHGGVTIGSGYVSTAAPTNGLLVEGAIQQAGNQVLHAGNYGGYSTFSGVVTSGSGFQTATYAVNTRNRIWSFGNADGYGLSYFQGTAGYTGTSTDTLGIHFGTATAAGSQFQFNQDSTFITKGPIRAGSITNGSYIEISGNLPGYADGTYPVIKSAGTIHFANNNKYSAFIEGSNTYFGLLNASTVTAVFLNTNGNSYLTGGNVGIGTTSPTQQLHLTGYARLFGISVNETGGTISAFIGYEKAWTGTGSSNSLAIAAETSNSLKFYTNGSATLRAIIDTSGNFGIGTASPSAKIHATLGTNGTIMILDGANSSNRIWHGFDGTGAYIEVNGDSSSNRILRLQGYDGSSSYTQFFINAATNRIYTSSTSFGINHTAPDCALSVNGVVHIGNGGNFLYMGGNAGSTGSWGSRHYTSGGNHVINANSFTFDNVGYGSTWSVTFNSGNITASGNVTAYSDVRLKTNIETLTNALEKVLSLRGVSYNRTDIDTERTHIGVIAQEIEQILPEVISENENGIKSVSYGNIVGILIEAIKELKKQLDDVKSQKH